MTKKRRMRKKRITGQRSPNGVVHGKPPEMHLGQVVKRRIPVDGLTVKAIGEDDGFGQREILSEFQDQFVVIKVPAKVFAIVRSRHLQPGTFSGPQIIVARIVNCNQAQARCG